MITVDSERPDEADPGRSPQPLTVIEVDEKLPADADVASVLQSTSGASVRRLGGLGDFAAVSIRGSSFRQVQIYLDGVPLNPDGAATVNLSELPLSAFERVEVYRGNAPPSFGAAPLGGVVNLVTGQADTPASVGLSGGSHGTGRLTGLGSIPVGPGRLLVLGEAFGTRGDFSAFADNGTRYNRMDDARVVRENNDKRQLSATARWRSGDETRGLQLSESLLARDEGLPGLVNAPALDARLSTLRSLSVAQAQGRVGDLHGTGRLWFQERREDYDDRAGELGTGDQLARRRYGTLGLLTGATWAPSSWLTPALTLSAHRDDYRVTDLLIDQTEAPRRRTAGTLSMSADTWAWGERVRFSPVVQADLLDNRALGTVPFSDAVVAPDGQDTLLAINPRAGLLVRPWDTDAGLKANVGRYLRPPDLSELFGDQGGIIGNTDLLPERGWQADVGLRRGWEHGAADLTSFWKLAQDQIVYVQNSQKTMVPVNLSRAWTQGVEGALTLDLLGWVDSQSNLTWTLSRNLTPRRDVANKQLPQVPTWQAWQATSVHWGERLRLGHTFSYTAGNYWDATNWFLAPPRAIHGAFLRASTPRLSVEASVLNLFNHTVQVMDQNPLDPDYHQRILQPLTDFVGYPLPGRTWMLTLKWTAPRSTP